MGYLLCNAVELGQDIEERHLRDNELLFLVLVEGSSREIQSQVHEGGLHHCLLVLVIMQQLFFFFCWLETREKRKEGRSVSSTETTTHMERNNVFVTFTSFCFEVNEEGAQETGHFMGSSITYLIRVMQKLMGFHLQRDFI